MSRLSICTYFLAILLTGCADGPETPLVERNAGYVVNNPATTFALTAERRLVVFNHNTRFYCAEGSPDAMQSLASVLSNKAGVSGTIPGEVVDLKIQNDYLRMIATSVATISPRSQGIVFLREGMFQLCLAEMNRTACLSTGASEGSCPDPVDFNRERERILDMSYQLIRAELPDLHKPIVLPAPPMPSPPTSGNTTTQTPPATNKPTTPTS